MLFLRVPLATELLKNRTTANFSVKKVVDNFDAMELKPELLRGIYAVCFLPLRGVISLAGPH